MKKIVWFLFFIHFIHAENSWSLVEEFASPGVIYHDIAFDSKGNAFALWLQKDQNDLVLETAIKPFQGKWESSILLSKLIKEGTAAPKIIVDSSDHVHLLWVENEGNNSLLKAALRSVDEEWSIPELITRGDALFPELVLAKNRFGSVFAIWVQEFSEDSSIVQTSEKEDGGSWSEPTDLTPKGHYGSIGICADGLRNVYAIWTSIEWYSPYVQTSQRLSKGHWMLLSDADSPGWLWGYYRKMGNATRIAANSLGDVFEISRISVDLVDKIVCSYKNAESDWTESRTISEDSGWSNLTLWPSIVVDDLGNAFSTWYRYELALFSKNMHSIGVVNYSKMEGWSNPQLLIEEETPVVLPRVAVDHLGNAVIVWTSLPKPDFVIQASFFSKDRGWSLPQDVSIQDSSPKIGLKLVIDPLRRVHISWIEGEENQGIIKMVSAQFGNL
jgi:hypothetical protein